MKANYFYILGNTLRMKHNNLAIFIIFVQILVIESAIHFQFLKIDWMFFLNLLKKQVG
jgi:hypothetical protein